MQSILPSALLASSLLMLGASDAPRAAKTTGGGSGSRLAAAPAPVAKASGGKLEVPTLSVQETATLDLPAGIPDSFTVSLPLAGTERTLRMDRHCLRAMDARLWQQTDDGWIDTELPPHRTYRGTIEGVAGSAAALSLIDGRIWGMIDLGSASRDGQRYTVQPLDELLPGSDPRAHVIYPSSAVLPMGGICGVGLFEMGGVDPEGQESSEGGVAAEQNWTVNISFDADFEFFQKNGSSATNTVNDIENVMNTVDFVYKRDAEIGYELATFVVRTTNDDPYTTNVMGDLLCEFRTAWNSAPENGINRNIAQLYTGKNISGSVIGLAWLGTMCNQTGNDCSGFGNLGYNSVESRFTTNFNFRVALSAHELGHNWGAQHCDGNSPCNIMCSAVNSCNGITGSNLKFGPSEITQLVSGRNSRTCDRLYPLPIAPPFVEDVPSSAVSTERWTYNDGVQTSTTAASSPTRSLLLNSSGAAAYDFDEIRSNYILLGGTTGAELKYQVRRINVESGKKLFVDYWSSGGDWLNINTIVSDGEAQASFVAFQHDLPANARHDKFRVRFRTEGTETNDTWYVDDIYVGPVTVNPPSNDECATVILITAAETPFTTVGATTSLPSLPSACNEANGTALVNDVWFLYIPDCNGTMTVSTCGSASFDTRLAVYPGSCPFVGVNPAACNDNGSGCANGTSRLEYEVTAGFPMYIRVGGVGGTGSGTLAVSCEPQVTPCPADLNGDGVVNASDLAQVLGSWGAPGGDVDGNGTTDATDIAGILGAWGACPG